MGGVLHADSDAERLIAAEVGEQGAVLFIRVVAQGNAETTAQQGQTTKQFLAVEGIHFGVAVVNYPHLVAQGLIERLFKTCVGIDFEIFPRGDSHAG
ncbi:hypothetical protein D3C84_731070 [compost metagenome]